ncbi:MAG TPA: hypothetical protein VH092_38475 [Urbifossiella sp.]|jgi:WD40 repeat protein|nr:hypothetical protein [Urbifossiella sp.]
MTTRPAFAACLAAAVFAPAAPAQPPAGLKVDVYGDPLPPGAVARLGTSRMWLPEGFIGSNLTPDGRFIVTPTADGMTRYDLATGLPAGRFGPAHPPLDPREWPQVIFSDDGKRAASVWSRGVVVWDVATGREFARVAHLHHADMPANMNETAALSADGSVLVVGGYPTGTAVADSARVLIWDVTRNEKRAELKTTKTWQACVAVSADGGVAATWGLGDSPRAADGRPREDRRNGALQFWDTAAARSRATVRVPDMDPIGVTLSPDGTVAAVEFRGQNFNPAQARRYTALLDTRTGKVLRRVSEKADSFHEYNFRFAPDGKTLAEVDSTGTVRFWGVADGGLTAEQKLLGAVPLRVYRVRYTAPGRAVVWAPAGQRAVAWEVPSGKALRPVGVHPNQVQSAAFTPDGKQVVTASGRGILRWDVAGRGVKRVVPDTSEWVDRATWFRVGPDGRTAAPLGPGHRLIPFDQPRQNEFAQLLDLTTGRPVESELPNKANGYGGYLAPDNRTLFFTPKNESPGVWDLTTGDKVSGPKVDDLAVTSAAVTPDRSRLAAAWTRRTEGGWEIAVTTWNLKTKRRLAEFVVDDETTGVTVAVAPDNRTALLTSVAGVTLFDLDTGRELKRIDALKYRVTAPAVFSPAGEVVIPFDGADPPYTGVIGFYDPRTGRRVKRFQGHAAMISCLAFSPDGRYLVSGADDTTSLIWDTAAPGLP